MDTYHCVDSSKCIKCYECIKLCRELHKEAHGVLGFMILDEFDGTPSNEDENPICRHCEAEIDGKKVSYPCNKLCPTGAMEITRW